MNLRTSIPTVRTGLGLVLCSLLGACVFNPADGKVIATQATSILVNGYASAASAALSIQCRSSSTASWSQITPTTASGSQANPGQITPLYEYTEQVVIPSSCWRDNGDFGHVTEMRVLEPGASNVTQLYTFTPAGQACVGNELSTDPEWVNAGAVCSTGSTMTIFSST